MYFAIERIKRILSELKDYSCINRLDIDNYKMKSCGYNDFLLLNEEADQWEDFKKGQLWGGKDKHFWFKKKIIIPKEYEGKTVVYEVTTGKEGEWDATNPQFLAFINGSLSQGLDVNHRQILLTDNAKADESYEVALYAYSGMLESLVELNSYISILETETEKLYYNIKVPIEVAEMLDEDDKRRINIVSFMTKAVNMLDLRIALNENYHKSIADANKYLEEEFYSKYCGNDDVVEVCVGHTHIDVAWLWTLDQTREKVVRSFSTVLSLMEKYPEYIFMSSQPQLYKFIKEDHPEIYANIKDKVKEGRWEVEGAMWLEADCNLTSGESLVRQIIYGKNFFKDEFGVDSKLLWLPDVFGYSAALPQILQKSGVNYFMTTKISWNEYNKMPYDTFTWRGIDGSEILTHFISTTDYKKGGTPGTGTTYNGNTNASQIMGCYQRYQQKEINSEVLNCFGYGDGGGGATKEMLEMAKRFEKGIPGAPKVKMGKALDFFNNLNEKLKENNKLPKWVGELYLEYHRGTYTSMARNKRYNRKTEFLNLEAEMLSTLSSIEAGTKYPSGELKKCWETTLLNQFHDIIPGSSIKEVYIDSKTQYEKINEVAKKIISTAVDNIASKLCLEETSVVVFNHLGFSRNDIAEFELPCGWDDVEIFDGERLIESQKVGGNKIVFYAQDIPAKGYKTFSIRRKQEVKIEDDYIKIGTKNIETEFFKIELDEKAHLISIYDKLNEREVLQEGKRGNVIQAFEDKPHNWDAWDINIYYQEKMWEVDDVSSIKVIEKGNVRSCLEVARKFLNSTLIQKIYIYKDIPRIDFENEIDWKERHILLKVAFPVDVHADKATYEIQYGNVERPTHWNTSWDYARFEVCAHKWADLSEGGYGVSLLNDCKYGHDIKNSVIRLSLLKSPSYPNVDADREVHKFIYSLYPHSGDFKEAGTAQMAYNLNNPLTTKVEEAHSGKLPPQMSLFRVDKENVIVEVVKQAERSEDIIVRMYECHNKRTKVKCSTLKVFKSAFECDLLENTLKETTIEDGEFSFEIKPFEIKTFKLRDVKELY
ncbi:alpha-mannosidase [Clostridium sp. YIM B02505]|uniref:Alpha-mannosidase n=1 Tax=Clostridium yunnanense TaxID=2800325 RepID=A0ABS1EJD1_9CLOT|nr:alpha-mannosidase [Clostridium yunnanense]MBK1809471.1 alpha-mannosidase [Clostridium yunnanense]